MASGVVRAVCSAATCSWLIGYLHTCTKWNMNQMVHSAMATSQARERLLAAAVDHAMRDGIADLSLRELAAAIGNSRSCGHSFGSLRCARRLWAHLSDPKLWPQERL